MPLSLCLLHALAGLLLLRSNGTFAALRPLRASLCVLCGDQLPSCAALSCAGLDLLGILGRDPRPICCGCIQAAPDPVRDQSAAAAVSLSLGFKGETLASWIVGTHYPLLAMTVFGVHIGRAGSAASCSGLLCDQSARHRCRFRSAAERCAVRIHDFLIYGIIYAAAAAAAFQSVRIHDFFYHFIINAAVAALAF